MTLYSPLSIQWIKYFDSFNPLRQNQLPKLAIDSQNSIYLTYVTYEIGQGQDITIIKMDRSGQTQKMVQQPTFNTEHDETYPSLFIDSLDYVYLSYQTSGSISASGQTQAGSGYDVVVAKFDSFLGDLLWIRQNPVFNSPFNDLTPSLVVDQNHFIYVTYIERENSGSGSDSYSYSLVIFKLESLNGQCLWVVRHPIQLDHYQFLANQPRLTVDLDNYLYLAYQAMVIQGNFDYQFRVIVIKIHPIDGLIIWSTGDQICLNPHRMAYDCQLIYDRYSGRPDSLYLAYSASDNGSNPQPGSNKPDSLMIIKIDPYYGQCLWIREILTQQTVPTLTTNWAGYLYLGYQSLDGDNSHAQDCDITITKLDPEQGNELWSFQVPVVDNRGNVRHIERLCQSADDLCPHLITDSSGLLYLTYQLMSDDESGINQITVVCLNPPKPHLSFIKPQPDQPNDYYGRIVIDPENNVPVIGDPVEFTFVVINDGIVPVYHITVNDNLGTEMLMVGDLTPNQQRVVRSQVYRLTRSDFEVGVVRGQATAEGQFYEDMSSCYGQCNVGVSQVAQLRVNKITLSADTFVYGFIVYRIEVHNTGNVSFHQLTLTDGLLSGQVGGDGDGDDGDGDDGGDGTVYQFKRQQLAVGSTWIEDPIRVQISPEMYQQFIDTGYVTNIAVVTGYDISGQFHTFYSNTNQTPLCLVGDGHTLIKMYNGQYKKIEEIERGDLVYQAPGKCGKVAQLCQVDSSQYTELEMIEIPVNGLGNGCPSQELLITGNHPIFWHGKRRPARSFIKFSGVKQHFIGDVEIIKKCYPILYDLQFETDGSYWANGIEVQSCSPRSFTHPLPKELYFDQSLYTDELVWDHYDQQIPLDRSLVTEF